ncbi:hypothetical protein AX17_002732 [Amanita inopinata Kibby_2008]|nr:hypothetical protein AX17_002732 [Amanita inopinata Kibby_2008]
MSPLKKQKTNTGSAVVTLHRFFHVEASNPKQCNPMSQLQRTRTKEIPANQEIIIINSDDDEVEIVEESKWSRPRKLKCEPQTVGVAVVPSVTGLTARYPSFGVPTLLQAYYPMDSGCPQGGINASSEEITKPSHENYEAPDVDSPKTQDPPLQANTDIQVDIDLSNEPDDTIDWATGDDELAFIPVQDDEQYLDNGSMLESGASSEYTEAEHSLPETTPFTCPSNAFSVLMSSFKENEAWKEASRAEDRKIRPTKSNRRKAPFYKVLQGMPIAVDAFRYGSIPNVTAYFLTHAHSDHYTNLSSSWKSGPIYCSEGTANLIIHMLAVDKKWVNPLPMDVPTVIPDTGGVRVTLIEANHCPGSCLFFFEGPQTVNAGDSLYKSPFIGSSKTFRYLHCGDFRASPRHVLHPAVKGKKIDHVYLDTTYLDPKYTFPPQPRVVSACADLAKRLREGGSSSANKFTVDAWMTKTSSDKQSAKPGRTLFIVGTYSIGKERIVKAIARNLQSKVYCDARKTALLRCQADGELDALLTADPLSADVHLLPLGMITLDKLRTYLERYKGHFKRAIGFRPTGWTYTQPAGADLMPPIATILSRSQHREYNYSNLQPSRQSTPLLQIYPVPYSEHSSFFELTCFAMSLDWGRMIATVNVGSEFSRAKMAKWMSKWEAERKKRVNCTIVPYRHPDYW